MAGDYVYENPPLGEVITEIFWTLVPLSAISGAFVDPFFETTSSAFRPLLAKRGFSHVERLLPEGVPLELTAGQPLFRFRASSNSWPLYQLGPGVFTCNVTPPYGGWSNFRRNVKDGLDALFEAFPVPEKQFRTNLIRLRYLNGFDAAFEYDETNMPSFIASRFGLALNIPSDILKRLDSSPEKIIPTFEVNIPNSQGAEMILRVARGEKNKKPALVLELWMQQQKNVSANTADALQEWFDRAHDTLHDVFELLATKKLKDAMGRKIPVEDIK